jgi:hypothetical protein
MKKILNFDTPYDFEITKETVGGLALLVNAKQSDGAEGLQIAPIADLNRISLEVDLVRANGREVKIMRGNLDDNLLGYYAQTVKHALVRKETQDGYYHYIDWNPFAVALTGEDHIRVRVTVGSAAYTSMRKTDSTIEFFTMNVKEGTSRIPVIKSFPIGYNEDQIDEDLGSNITKIVAATDFAATYQASTEAKLTSGDLRAVGLDKPFTGRQLYLENMHMFDNNPESDVEDLVIYTGAALDNVKLRASLDKPATAKAKIITTSLENI